MTRLVGLRLLKLVPVLFLVSLATFFLVDLVPGDPAIRLLGDNATPEQVEAVRSELGLDEPVFERYIDWLTNALQGDLGNSLLRPSFSVSELIAQSLPITLEIAAMGMLIAIVVSIPTAMWAAYREGGAFDRASNAATSALISIPSFVAALLLAYFFVFQPNVPRFIIFGLGLGAGAWALVTAFRQRAVVARRATLVWTGWGVAILAATAALTMWFPEFNRTGSMKRRICSSSARSCGWSPTTTTAASTGSSAATTRKTKSRK